MPIPPEQRFILPTTATSVEEHNRYWRELMKWTDTLPFFPTQIDRRKAAIDTYTIAWNETAFTESWNPLFWADGSGGTEECAMVFWKSESWTGVELTVHLQQRTDLTTTRDVSIQHRAVISYLSASTLLPLNVSPNNYLGFKYIDAAAANIHQAWSHTCILPPHPAGWVRYTIQVDAFGPAGGVGAIKTSTNDEICIVARELPYWQTEEPPL